MVQVDRPSVRRSEAILARNFFGAQIGFPPRKKKGAKKKENQACGN